MSEDRAQRPVLVVAAHPDDEILGCGGTVARHVALGDPVTVIISAVGRPDDATYAEQRSYTKRALLELGVDDIRELGFPDQRLDTFPITEIVEALERIVRDVRPAVVYGQHGGDANRDHQVLFTAMVVATRPTEMSIQDIYVFDTASSTEWGYPRSFVPDTWVDISETLEKKLAAMACYESELREYPHPRSLEALRYRAHATGNQCCMPAAEAFMTVRRVRRGGQTSL